MNHDVFNGDADGICALHQLRLAFPAANNLVTGTKREIDLLRRVEAGSGDEVTVLDLALDKNREALLALLCKGVKVSYFDHHVAEDIPEHPNLTAMIDTISTKPHTRPPSRSASTSRKLTRCANWASALTTIAMGSPWRI